MKRRRWPDPMVTRPSLCNSLIQRNTLMYKMYYKCCTACQEYKNLQPTILGSSAE